MTFYTIEWVEQTLNRTVIEADSRKEALHWFYETSDFRVHRVAGEIEDVKVTKEAS